MPMGTVLVVLRLGLAAVFVTAGIGKLLDRSGSRQALLDFGVPGRWAPLGARALPLAELIVAVGLVLRPTARWAAVGAALLLAAFITGISVALARGRAPDCHCFGQIHSSPAGRGTLVRNGVLAAVAVVVISTGPGPATDSWVSAGHGHPLVLVALVVLGLFGFLAARETRRRTAAREQARDAAPAGLEIGETAPDFELSNLAGETVSLAHLRARGKPVLLAFTHQGCGPCTLLMPDLARWQAALADKVTIVVLASGDVEHHRSLKAEHGFTDLLLQEDMEVFYRYKMAATPGAVLVSAAGQIDGASVFGPHAIQQMTRLAIRRIESASLNGGASEPFASQRFAGPVIVDPAGA